MHKGLMFARSFGGLHPADAAYHVVSTALARRGIAALDLASEMDACAGRGYGGRADTGALYKVGLDMCDRESGTHQYPRCVSL